MQSKLPVYHSLPSLEESTPLSPVNQTHITLVHKPNRHQAQILIAHPLPSHQDPDSWALKVAIMAMGGTFSSPLMQEIRVKRGLSYGAQALVIEEQSCSFMLMSATPQIQDAFQTLTLMHEILQQTANGELSTKDILFAQTHLINALN